MNKIDTINTNTIVRSERNNKRFIIRFDKSVIFHVIEIYGCRIKSDSEWICLYLRMCRIHGIQVNPFIHKGAGKDTAIKQIRWLSLKAVSGYQLPLGLPPLHLWLCPGSEDSSWKQTFVKIEVPQSQKRPLLDWVGTFTNWKSLLALSHLRHWSIRWGLLRKLSGSGC